MGDSGEQLKIRLTRKTAVDKLLNTVKGTIEQQRGAKARAGEICKKQFYCASGKKLIFKEVERLLRDV